MRRRYGRRGRFSRKRRAFRRRAAYRLRRRRARRSLARLGRAVVPNSRLVKFSYSDVIYMGGIGTNTVNFHSFCANGIWDPDATGGGHSVSGMAEWASFFDKYCVLGAKITCTPVPTSGMNDMLFGLGIHTPAQYPTTREEMLEDINGKTRVLRGSLDNANLVSLTAKYSPRKFWGIKDTTDDLVQWASMGTSPTAPGTNPTSLAFFHLTSVNFGPGNPQTGYYIKVNVQYIVKMAKKRAIPTTEIAV